MPYPNHSPFKERQLRQLVTATCYAEVALAADGEWNPTALESKVEGKAYWEQSGRFRRLAKGIVPRDKTAKHLQQLSDGRCDITWWRDHPFWQLLTTRQPTHQDIYAALLSVTSNVKHYLWLNPPRPDKVIDYRLVRITPKKEDIVKIAKYKNFDALVALVAFAREGFGSGMLQESTVASIHLRKIFPEVVARTPHLYLIWPNLATRLKKIIWKAKTGFEIELKLDVSTQKIRQRVLDARDAAISRGISLPPEPVVSHFQKLGR